MKVSIFIRTSLLLSIWLLGPKFLSAQTPEANELFQLRQLTISQLNSLNTAIEGTLVYNPETNTVFYRDGSRWVNTKQKTYSGVLTITTRNTNITIDDLPFTPTRVEFKAFANVDAVNLNDDNSTGNNNDNSIQNSFGYMVGFAQSTGRNSFDEQVIYVGGSGNSINDISRFSSDRRCIAVRYSDDDGDEIGETQAEFRSFENFGFTIRVRDADDPLIVIYTAYQ